MNRPHVACSIGQHAGALCVAVLTIVIALWDRPVSAREAPLAPTGSDDVRSIVASKLELLDVLVYRSPAVKRIEASQDAEAKRLLEQARAHFRDVQGRLETADLAALEERLDEGLRTAGMASRRVVDAERQLQLDRERYGHLRQRVMTFREALARVVAEKSLSADQGLDAAQFDSDLMAAARAADAGEYAQANQQLQDLAKALETALARVRHQDTLVYELKFDSPEAEYAYEQERNRGHVMLLDMLRQSRPTTAQAARQFDVLLEKNEVLKREAEAHASRGEIEEAVTKLEEGTDHLVQALRIGGLRY